MPDSNEVILEQPAQRMSTDLARECETAVGREWVGLFGLQASGDQRTFFELGGDSLMAVNLVQRLAERFNLALNVVDVFEHPTASTLAGFVHQCLSEQGSASAPAGGAQEFQF